MQPNAAAQPRPEAGATQERRLEGVGCSGLLASFPTSYGLSATNCTSAHWPFRTTSRDGSS